MLRAHFFLELPWAFRKAFQLGLLPTFQVWTKMRKEMGHWLISEIEKAIGNDIKHSRMSFSFFAFFFLFFIPLEGMKGVFQPSLQKRFLWCIWLYELVWKEKTFNSDNCNSCCSVAVVEPAPWCTSQESWGSMLLQEERWVRQWPELVWRLALLGTLGSYLTQCHCY